MEKLDDFLSRLKYEYLALKEGVGGYAEEWREFLIRYYRQHKEEFDGVIEQALELAATPIWRDKRKSKGFGTADLFIGGKPCPDEISYADRSVPGGYVTVLVSFASIEQFRRHCMVLQDNANKVQLAAIEAWNLHQEMFDRAGGDETRRVADFFDIQPSPPDSGARPSA